MKKSLKTAVAAAIVLTAGAALADPAVKCRAAKTKVVGAYYACREKAEATAIAKGGLPDYTKCSSKFTDKWNTAESASVDSCPDHVAMTSQMDLYLSGQAADSAAIVAGTGSIPECGDGAIDTAGEHCDGTAFGGFTCESFGLHGSLACTSLCAFDLSACSTCPAPGIEYGNSCWVLGALEANCDTACATLGLVYDSATSIIAGSDGSNTNCVAVLDALGAPGGALNNPGGDCTAGYGLGCSVNPEAAFRGRCGTPPTTATSTDVGVRRACACM